MSEDRAPKADDVLKALRFTEPPPEAKSSGRPPSPPPRKTDLKTLEDDLTQLFALPAMAFQLRGDEWCAQHILTNAEVPARAWAKLAEKNERIYRVLRMLTSGGAYTEALMATAAFVVPMLAHHGKAPKELASFLGVGDVPDWEPGGNVQPIHPPTPKDDDGRQSDVG